MRMSEAQARKFLAAKGLKLPTATARRTPGAGSRQSSSVDDLFRQCEFLARDRSRNSVGLEHPVREFRFHPTRRWRLDIAFPSRKLYVEIEGGLFAGSGGVRTSENVGGRHNLAMSMREDMVKYNEAAALGWTGLRVMPEMVKDGRATDWIIRAWKERTDAENQSRRLDRAGRSTAQ